MLLNHPGYNIPVVSNRRIMNREGFGKDWSWIILRYCCNIFMEGLQKIMKNFSWDSWL
jgi:hypothetical protein